MVKCENEYCLLKYVEEGVLTIYYSNCGVLMKTQCPPARKMTD